ncbi:MAG TPA: diguanylate cyclase [Nitrospirae bacterium]|nr:diguanylate cyclase [Nitrospirota bacterium]
MKRPHILIVDDKKDIRLTLEITLRADGYRVSCAASGEIALDMVNKDRPDLVLLDIMMPDLDGYEICRRLKKNEKTRGIKVVFASAMRKTKDKIEGLDIGADDFITKPFNIPELLAKLRVHFRVMDYHRKFEKLVGFAHNINVLDIDTMAQAIKNELGELITADRFSVFTTDKDGGHFRLIAHNHAENEMDGLEMDFDKSPMMAEALRRMEEVSESDFPGSRFAADVKRDKYTDDYALCLPLQAGSELLGVLNINGNSNGFFDNLEFNFVALIAEILSASLKNLRQLELLRHLAITDGLTSLLNHRVFHERLSSEFDRSKRFKQPLSLMMADIDYFKKVNDTYGHPVGDQILKAIAGKLKAHLRTVDVVARYGGEEYAMLLPQTDANLARAVAERIRKDIESESFTTDKGKLKVTVSLGICDTTANNFDSGARLLAKADEALYEAKNGGRNQTVIYNQKDSL